MVTIDNDDDGGGDDDNDDDDDDDDDDDGGKSRPAGFALKSAQVTPGAPRVPAQTGLAPDQGTVQTGRCRADVKKPVSAPQAAAATCQRVGGFPGVVQPPPCLRWFEHQPNFAAVMILQCSLISKSSTSQAFGSTEE